MSDYINQADIPVEKTIAEALGFDADGNWAKMVPADPADVQAAQKAATAAKTTADAAKTAADAAKTAAERIATTEVPGSIKASETVVVAPDGTATVPAATETQAGVVKPGAGLTTEADGTTRIADDAHLPGAPTVDNNYSALGYIAPSAVIANQLFVQRTVFGTARGYPGTPDTGIWAPLFFIDNSVLNIITTFYLTCPISAYTYPTRIIFTRNKRAGTIKFYLMPPGATGAKSRLFGIAIDFEEIEAAKPYLITIYPNIVITNGEVQTAQSKAYYTIEELSAVDYYVRDAAADGSQGEGAEAEPAANEGEEAADA